MGNINDSLSHCEFELFNNYELDWISEKTWKIETNLQNNSYTIKKGKLDIEINKLFNIILSKKIENIKNIKNLKINFNIDHNLSENFYFNIYLYNEDNIKSKVFIDKIIFNSNCISFTKKNNKYESNELDTNKFILTYNLNFSNSGIIISNRNINKNKNNFNSKIIFTLNYQYPIYINFEIYNKNTSEKISYFKLNL